MRTKKRITELEGKIIIEASEGTITLHESKFLEVVDKAMEIFHFQRYPFDKEERVRPEAVLPKGMRRGSLEHAIYLFCTVNLDGSKKAEQFYRDARNIFEEVRSARDFLQLQESNLRTLVDKHMGLGKSGTGGYDEPIKVFAENSQRLLEQYDSDPRKIFEDRNPDNIIKRLVQFRQYGVGKACLLIKAFISAGLFEPDDLCDIPIKVDRHITRIFAGTRATTFNPEFTITPVEEGDPTSEITTVEYRVEKFRKESMKLLRKITREQRINPIDLDTALWGIGSSMCDINLHAVCQAYCTLDCARRPELIKKASYIRPGTEMREGLNFYGKK